ncbi:MAG: GNAT family N-acetyltransferase [Bacilli bacterium]|nr:GNAT family N-acetyltransferase [Bacilli bacterium]
MLKKEILTAGKDFIKLWNQEFKNYQLTEALYEERLKQTSNLILEGSCALYSESEFIAIIILKKGPDFDLKAREVAFISLLYVNPKYRRKKIGSELLELAFDEARKNKFKYLLTGCDYGNFFSGTFSDSSKNFFEKQGFSLYDKNYNLLIASPSKTVDSRIRLVEDEREKQVLLEFVKRFFSIRWYSELENARCDDLVIALENDEIIGFARIANRDSLILPNSLTFHLRYRNLGGLGPLGVSPNFQGQGLGKVLVQNAVRLLFERGVSEVLVDWTGLIKFYQKCGFLKVVDEFTVYGYIL